MSDMTVGQLNVKLSMELNSLQAQLDSANKRVSSMYRKMHGDAKSAANGMQAAFGDELKKISHSLERAFSPTNFAKGILAGFGIGSASSIIDTAIGKYVEMWGEAARHATEVDARAKSIEEVMQRLSKLRIEAFESTLGPSDQITFKTKQIEAMVAQMKALESRRENAISGITSQGNLQTRLDFLNANRVSNFNGEDFTKNGSPISALEFRDLMEKRADDAQKSWAELAVRVAEVRKEIRQLEDANINLVSPFADPEAQKGVQELIAKMAELQAITDAWRESKQQAENDDIKIAGKRFIEAEKIRMDKEHEASVQQRKDNAELAQSYRELADLFDGSKEHPLFNPEEMSKSSQMVAEEMNAIWGNLIDNVSSDLADLVVDGEMSFDKLASSFAKMVVAMVAKWAILQAMESVGMSISGMRASGGPVEAGNSYIVGEQGPELFTPSASGMIVPNSALSTSNTESNVVFNVDARGADVAAVARLEAWSRNMERNFSDRAKAAVADGRMRGQKI